MRFNKVSSTNKRCPSCQGVGMCGVELHYLFGPRSLWITPLKNINVMSYYLYSVRLKSSQLLIFHNFLWCVWLRNWKVRVVNSTSCLAHPWSLWIPPLKTHQFYTLSIIYIVGLNSSQLSTIRRFGAYYFTPCPKYPFGVHNFTLCSKYPLYFPTFKSWNSKQNISLIFLFV